MLMLHKGVVEVDDIFPQRVNVVRDDWNINLQFGKSRRLCVLISQPLDEGCHFADSLQVREPLPHVLLDMLDHFEDLCLL